jgi:polar amino acid transport system substrate-binding protein
MFAAAMLLIATLCCGLIVLDADALADSPLTLRLVTGPDYKPFTDPSLPQGGMHAEIVEAAFAKVGDHVTIEFEPWARGYADAQRGLYDATFPYARTAEREQDFLYSDALYAQINRPYVMSGSLLQAGALGELAGRTMCFPHGYFLTGQVKAMIDQNELKLEAPDSMQQCFKMLKAGRVDFVNSIDAQARAASMQLFGSINAVKPLAVAISAASDNLIVSRRHPDRDRILADFNRGLALLKASGEFDAIVKRHLDAFFGAITN